MTSINLLMPEDQALRKIFQHRTFTVGFDQTRSVWLLTSAKDGAPRIDFTCAAPSLNESLQYFAEHLATLS